jgi:hypothetical protein
VRKSNGEFVAPQPVKGNINTVGDEVTPFSAILLRRFSSAQMGCRALVALMYFALSSAPMKNHSMMR